LKIDKNKFARSAQRRTKPNAFVRDNTPTIDQQLARLEEDIRRLKIEFDIYFNGAAKRPPYDTKSRVETVIKRLGDDRTMTYAQKYFYNSLIARYGAFREVWRRTMKGREEGRERHFRPAPKAAEEPRVEVARSIFVVKNPTDEVESVRNLYSALVEAKKMCNEPVEDLQFSHFQQMISKKTDSLKEHLSCEQVRFSVGVENGKVSFKAKAHQEE
jgi:hypothetical protein